MFDAPLRSGGSRRDLENRIRRQDRSQKSEVSCESSACHRSQRGARDRIGGALRDVRYDIEQHIRHIVRPFRPLFRWDVGVINRQ